MRASAFDFVGNLDTLLAVVIGAMLATIGGIVSEHYEDGIERRRRQRDAARFFGEILRSIDALIDRAIESQKFGDPWGPVTQRLFRTAMREADVYERNRERLFDIQDVALRTRIHTHVISEIFPLEGMLEGCDRIAAISDTLESMADLSDARRGLLDRRLAEFSNLRDRSLDFIRHEQIGTADLCVALQRLAEIDFKTGAKIARAAAPEIPK